jgi:hypothetical protein
MPMAQCLMRAAHESVGIRAMVPAIERGTLWNLHSRGGLLFSWTIAFRFKYGRGAQGPRPGRR